MKLVPSPRFRKSLRRLDPQTQERVREKLKVFLENNIIRRFATKQCRR